MADINIIFANATSYLSECLESGEFDIQTTLIMTLAAGLTYAMTIPGALEYRDLIVSAIYAAFRHFTSFVRNVPRLIRNTCCSKRSLRCCSNNPEAGSNDLEMASSDEQKQWAEDISEASQKNIDLNLNPETGESTSVGEATGLLEKMSIQNK